MIVKDDRLPRGLWKLGIVQETMRGRDGQTRAAVVMVASRDRQHLLLKRPIQLLYPLELHHESMETTLPEAPPIPESDELLPEEEDAAERARPKRAASKKADEVWRRWIAELENCD